jgi:predicted metalloprotease with PDZ domain
MKRFTTSLFCMLWMLLLAISVQSQTLRYEIAFPNAEHHEAEISITFTQVTENVLQVRMPRSSPGRYAIHEFAKNVYHFKAFDSQGKALEVYRPNPYQWDVAGHDGTVIISYTLFANRADGTYSGIDARQAHLNMPATFMYARGLEHRPIEIFFNTRHDLQWLVATQLKNLGDNRFFAPDMQYFMDSPTMISAWKIRQWKVGDQTIRFVLLHLGNEAELDAYVEQVKKVVLEQQAIFGELPRFDYGEYLFLASYNPWVAGDGMEHRNSTILTGNRSLAQGGNIGTVAHEFFHAWNVERIRPKSLEPFDFEQANMSGELWFAEGFTSYYTNLTLVRAGLMTEEQYIRSLSGGINAVMNSPGPGIHSVIEMSYQAPFVDAASSIDPVNRANTFVSYYTYGSVLGLALDLMIRQQFEGKSLDTYMQEVWKVFGRTEIAYTHRGLREVLAAHTSPDFANHYFDTYIHGKTLPDFSSLLEKAGVNLHQPNIEKASLGQSFTRFQDGKLMVMSDVIIGSPLYQAKISKGDVILSINGKAMDSEAALRSFMDSQKPENMVEIKFEQMGIEKSASVSLAANPSYTAELMANPDSKTRAFLNNWLQSKLTK